MAPPSFPQGMTLHSIGYAALKYPSLAPELEVPLGNQIAVLQRINTGDAQDHMIAQIGSQYLEALIAYQTGDDPVLNDPSSPQYYFSTALCVLNFMTSSPDVCIRLAAHPTLFPSIINKLLAPDFETRMRAVDRTAPPPFPSSTFEDEFGSILQLVSTLLMFTDSMPGGSAPANASELVPKVRAWKQAYRGSRVTTIGNASERLVTQLQGRNVMAEGVRIMIEGSLVCGLERCGKREGREGMKACGACGVQRYCGKECQRGDWRWHKHICKKGLVEE